MFSFTALAALIATSPVMAPSTLDPTELDVGWEHRTVCVEVPSEEWADGFHVDWALDQWNKNTDHVELIAKVACHPKAQTIKVYTYFSSTDGLGGWEQHSDLYVGDDDVMYLTRAEVHINQDSMSDPCWRATVVAHEIGHALGLPHTDSTDLDAIMGESYDVETGCGRVGHADIAYLNKIYG